MAKLFKNYNTLTEYEADTNKPTNVICFIKDSNVIYLNNSCYSYNQLDYVPEATTEPEAIEYLNKIIKNAYEIGLIKPKETDPVVITGYAIDSNPFAFSIYEFEECTVNVYPDSTGYFEITKGDIEEAINKRDFNIHPTTTFGFIESNYLLNYLFNNCINIKTVDFTNISNWTTNYHKIRGMFYGCTNLVSVDLNQIAPYMHPTDDNLMLNTFYKCTSLKEVNFGNYDTSKVITFNSAFFECSSLETLDLHGLDTTNITNTVQMFSRCTSLKYLDISGWDLSNCVKYTEMFNKCNALKTIRMVGCNQATIDLVNSVKKSVSTIVTT